MKLNFSFIFLLIIVIHINIFNYVSDNNQEYDRMEYKEKKYFNLTGKEKNIYLKMDVDKILSKTYAYFYVYLTDPTKVEFNFGFEKNGEPKNFERLNSFAVINHGSDHTVYYRIEKPLDKGNILYMKIIAYNYYENQKIAIESSETQTNIYLIIGIIIGITMSATLVIIGIYFYLLYTKKRDRTIIESNEDVIIEKVNPNDFL